MTLTAAFALWLGLTGCEVVDEDDPCQDYIDYMCDCHDGEDDGPTCEELENQLSGADADLQDQCAIDLDEQIAEDEDNGVECPV